MTDVERDGFGQWISHHLGLIELVLVLTLVLGFAIWELVKTNRAMRDDDD